MLRVAIWTLRQRRWAALAVTMGLLGLVCVGAGTFELHRFREKVADNQPAQGQCASPPTVPLTTGLVPLTGRGPRARTRWRSASAQWR